MAKEWQKRKPNRLKGYDYSPCGAYFVTMCIQNKNCIFWNSHRMEANCAPPTISTMVNQLKGVVTKQIGQPIWQRSFHDHIIRDKRDYKEIWRYIGGNPLKQEQDCFYVE